MELMEGGTPPEVWALPRIGGLGAVPPAGVQGAEPPLGVRGEPPQKLKPKNTLEASQKRSGDVNVVSIVDNSLLIFAQFVYLQRLRQSD